MQQLITGAARHRLVAELTAHAQASDTLRRQLEENDCLDQLPEVAMRIAVAHVGKVEQRMIAAGLTTPLDDRDFRAAWRRLNAESGRASTPAGADWLAGSSLTVTRGDPVEAPSPPGISIAEAGQLIRIAVEAAGSKPEQTTSDVAVLHGDGAVVKRSQVVTRRTSA